VLELCRAAREEPQAALAAQRWEEWQQARRRVTARGERRFRRRAYERARESALAVLLMRAQAAAREKGRAGPPGRATPAGVPRRRPGSTPSAPPTIRLHVLLGQYRGRR